MHVSIEDHPAQEETRTFVDIQTQAVPRFNHVVHVHFRVAMLSIKHFKEEREIVGARGAQSEILDRSDLLFESDAQFFFLERRPAAEIDDAGPLGAFFLLLHDRPPLFLSLFWSHYIDALRCYFKGEGNGTERKEDSVSHVSENESDTSVSLENRHEHRRRR